jgi:hypothetical protein
MLRYEGRCAQILDNDATTMKMVDDCGNCWDCVLMFGSTPYEHCKIGGSGSGLLKLAGSMKVQGLGLAHQLRLHFVSSHCC